MGAGLPGGHQLRPCQDPGERQARRDALGHDQDVRLDVPVLDREHLAGPPEAGLDLVGDEQDPVLAGDLAEPRQEPRRRHDVAALAEDRLDDDRRDAVRVDELVERQVELGLPVARAGVRGVRAAGRPVAVRVGGVVDGAGQRLEGAAVDVLGGRQRHRLGRPAVVAVAERHDRRPAGRHAGELDRRLDRLGAGVRQERLPRAARAGPCAAGRRAAGRARGTGCSAGRGAASPPAPRPPPRPADGRGRCWSRRSRTSSRGSARRRG